jgi:D-3-phosphoglycerate dehydrogenase
LAEKLGKFLGQILEDNFSEIEIGYKGEITKVDPSPLSTVILKGILESISQEGLVNFVNAPVIAKVKGISIRESKVEKVVDYANGIEVSVKTEKGVFSVAGTLFSSIGERIINVNGFTLSAIPQGDLIICPHKDMPGIIGKIGVILGDNKINVGGMQVGRDKVGGNAIMLINIDGDVSDKVLAEISSIAGMSGSAKLVRF